MVNFDTAFDRLIGHEGGYINHPKDPGGETNWGISKRQYPDLDIKNLTRDDAKKIYFRDYWQPVGSFLDTAVTFQVFDAAVNHGIQTAIRLLQRAIGVADDGYFGEVSLGKYKEMSTNDVLLRFLAERLDFFTRLTTFDSFGRGWSRRIVSNLRYASIDN